MKRIIALFSCLLWLEANAATPSYSNFSSNQFAPSGTYTVTVKSGAVFTNTTTYGNSAGTNSIFIGPIGEIASNANGSVTFSGGSITNTGFISSSNIHRFVGAGMAGGGSVTGMVIGLYFNNNGNRQFGIRNEETTNTWRFAGNVLDYVDSGGNSQPFAFSTPVGTLLQFAIRTGGVPLMVISNGMVGIAKANPTNALDVAGGISSSLSVTAPGFNGTTNAAINGATVDMNVAYQYTNAAGAVTFTGLSNTDLNRAKKTTLWIDSAAAGGDVTVTVPVSWKSHTPGTTYYVTNLWIGRFEIIQYGAAFTNLVFELVK